MLRGKRLEHGVRGSITFAQDGRTYSAEGALLRFIEGEGVTLEWTGDAPWADPLPLVRGWFPIGAIAIPGLRMRGSEHNAGGAHYKYFGSELYFGFGTDDVYLAPALSAAVPIPLLHTYVNRLFIQWSNPEPGKVRYEASDIRIPVGEIGQLGQGEIVILAQGNSTLAGGAHLTADAGIRLVFSEQLAAAVQVRSVWCARELFEFLMYRPNRFDHAQFHMANGEQVRYRRASSAQFMAADENVPWELAFAICDGYLGVLWSNWQERYARSREVDNMFRIMRFPNLPLDLRFFMAYTALGLVNVETTPGMNPKQKLRGGEKDHLVLNEDAWKVLLPGVDDVGRDHYYQRVANTRHDIAHLSRETHEVLVDKKDIGRAMMQLVCVTRARLFRHMGLPPDKVQLYLKAMAQQLRQRFHEIPTNLFQG